MLVINRRDGKVTERRERKEVNAHRLLKGFYEEWAETLGSNYEGARAVGIEKTDTYCAVVVESFWMGKSDGIQTVFSMTIE